MPVPTSVIAVLLGAKSEDYGLWGEWSDEIVQGDYPRFNRNDRGEGLAGAHPEFTKYVDEMIAARKADPDPPDDFTTRLLRTKVDGIELSDVELRTLLIFLLVSGNETTRHLISNLLHRLASQEGLLAALQADPSLIPAAVEECLRLDEELQRMRARYERVLNRERQRRLGPTHGEATGLPSTHVNSRFTPSKQYTDRGSWRLSRE